jgi:hypothetical protein
MANFYNAVIPRPAGIPATVELRVFAGRVDGGDLTAEELAALRAAFPNASAPAKEPAKPAGKAKSATSTKPRKAPAKRAAARRP